MRNKDKERQAFNFLAEAMESQTTAARKLDVATSWATPLNEPLSKQRRAKLDKIQAGMDDLVRQMGAFISRFGAPDEADSERAENSGGGVTP